MKWCVVGFAVLVGFGGLAACSDDPATPADTGGSAADSSLLPADAAGTPDAADAGAGPDVTAPDVADAGSSPLTPAPRAVTVARTTAIPACTLFVDAANRGTADGTAAQPYPAIADAVATAENDAVICVAEG